VCMCNVYVQCTYTQYTMCMCNVYRHNTQCVSVHMWPHNTQCVTVHMWPHNTQCVSVHVTTQYTMRHSTHVTTQYTMCMCNVYRSHPIQGGEDPQDALSCRSISAKEPLFIGLFCGNVYVQCIIRMTHTAQTYIHINIYMCDVCAYIYISMCHMYVHTYTHVSHIYNVRIECI